MINIAFTTWKIRIENVTCLYCCNCFEASDHSEATFTDERRLIIPYKLMDFFTCFPVALHAHENCAESIGEGLPTSIELDSAWIEIAIVPSKGEVTTLQNLELPIQISSDVTENLLLNLEILHAPSLNDTNWNTGVPAVAAPSRCLH
jgi:hypothetical protein